MRHHGSFEEEISKVARSATSSQVIGTRKKRNKNRVTAKEGKEKPRSRGINEESFSSGWLRVGWDLWPNRRREVAWAPLAKGNQFESPRLLPEREGEREREARPAGSRKSVVT